MTEKKWAAIAGYLGRYAVSDEGEVLSMDYARSGLPGLMKPYLRDGRYLSVRLCHGDGIGSMHRVHVLVADAFVGPKPSGMQVNHKDGDKTNNRAANLEYCTPSQNVRHAHALGLVNSARGEKQHLAKLKEADVLKIRELLALGLTQSEIGRAYGVCAKSIAQIKNGKTWAHAGNTDAAGESLTALV